MKFKGLILGDIRQQSSLPRVKTFSGKEIINNWVVSRHIEDNKRQIRDLP